MSYLGKVALKASDIRRLDVTSSTSATHTLTWTPPNEQSLIITINGVKQQNNYTISGTTLTLDTALVATDEMEVIGINDIGTTNVPGSGVITNDMLSSSFSVDTADLADDAVTADKLANSINTEIAANTAKVTNATHTGDVTGATALTIASGAVDLAMLSATGTASATTFLRGDNSWASAGGDNTPAFQAYLSGSDQSIAHGTDTKVECNSEDYDTASAYDNTTNYRFTVPSGEGGKYFCYGRMVIEGPAQSTLNLMYGRLYVNGSNQIWSSFDFRANPAYAVHFQMAAVIDLSAGDYLELYAHMQNTTSAAGVIKNYGNATLFGAYKMIGI